jgi:hypothetical protein
VAPQKVDDEFFGNRGLILALPLRIGRLVRARMARVGPEVDGLTRPAVIALTITDGEVMDNVRSSNKILLQSRAS